MNGRIVTNGPSDIKADEMTVGLLERILDRGMLVRVACKRLGTSDAFKHQIQDTDIYMAILSRSGMVHIVHYHMQRPMSLNCETFEVKVFFKRPPKDTKGHSLDDALQLLMKPACHFRWALAQQNLACIQLHGGFSKEVPLYNPFVVLELDRLQKHVQDILTLGGSKHHEDLNGLSTAHFNECISALLRENMGNMASAFGL